jgi:oxygen-independent coproporphyrinogen-3 oxidase
MGRDPLSLYLHIPFCSLKCRYCDFNSYAGLDELVPPYVDALIAEMGLWRKAVRGRPVTTVFFGGGTPSLLPLPHLARVIAALRDSFDLDPEAEVTLEANPGTVDLPYLEGLLGLGVNRLSLGVQSLHDDELATLDRIHSAQEAREAYLWARQAGFRRLSLDLIYGLPEQPPERWQATLDEAIELAPDHLSLYALTVEDGTGLAYDIDHGRAPTPDADAQAAMYEWSGDRLARAGYRQYEISNWARPVLSEAEGPGQECRHNLVYWRNGDWLGLGAGAHSHLAGTRFAVVYSPQQYVRRLQQTAGPEPPEGGDTPSLLKSMAQLAYVEESSPETAMADTAILALRLNDGLSLAGFRVRFGRAAEDVYGPALAELTELGLIERKDGSLRLTPRGRLLANEVFLRLLPD